MKTKNDDVNVKMQSGGPLSGFTWLMAGNWDRCCSCDTFGSSVRGRYA